MESKQIQTAGFVRFWERSRFRIWGMSLQAAHMFLDHQLIHLIHASKLVLRLGFLHDNLLHLDLQREGALL